MYTTLNIKTEKTLKAKVQKIAEELGVPLSTIVNAFLKQFARDREIAFSATLKPSPVLGRILEEIEEDTKKGKNISRPFNSVDEFINELEK